MSHDLIYFNVRARCEPHRMIAKYRGIEMNDEFITFPEWGGGEKASGTRHKYGQLPSLRTPDGKIYSQSRAIARYLAQIPAEKDSVYPSDPVDALETDGLVDLSEDMVQIMPIMNFYDKGGDTYNQAYEKYYGALEPRLAALTKILGEKKMFGGDVPLLGDFFMYHILELTEQVKPGCLDEYPTLKVFLGHFAELPGVKEYLATRPGADEGCLLNPKSVFFELTSKTKADAPPPAP